MYEALCRRARVCARIKSEVWVDEGPHIYIFSSLNLSSMGSVQNLIWLPVQADISPLPSPESGGIQAHVLPRHEQNHRSLKRIGARL